MILGFYEHCSEPDRTGGLCLPHEGPGAGVIMLQTHKID